jgi:hypothetical protein
MIYKPGPMYKNEEHEFDPDFCILSYGPKTRLVVERDKEKWSWTEVDKDFKMKTVQYNKFNTFMDAVKNYEETSYHDNMELR